MLPDFLYIDNFCRSYISFLIKYKSFLAFSSPISFFSVKREANYLVFSPNFSIYEKTNYSTYQKWPSTFTNQGYSLLKR